MQEPVHPSLTLESARRLVRERFGARASVPVPLSAGEWSRAYSLTLDGAEAVLRLGAHGEDFEKDRAAAHLAAPRVPVPRVLESGPFDDAFYCLAPRARGTALDDLTGAGMEAVLPALLRTLDTIGALDVSDTSGYGMWTASRTAPHGTWGDALLAIATETPRVPGWRAALERSDTGPAPFDAGIARLSQLAPNLPAERRLIHGDLLSRNVLTVGDGITAVLDWGNALYGDHLYDAARLLYWWPWYPRWRRIDLRSRLTGHWRATSRVPDDLEDRLLAYRLHIGLDAIAYCAFKGRWDEVRRNSRTVLELAGGR